MSQISKSDVSSPSLSTIEKAVPGQGDDDWIQSVDPQNWSNIKKSYYTMSIAFLGFAVTAGSSVITPSTAEIAETFGVSTTAAILPLSLYVLGLAWGPLLAAPISEQYGRTIVYKLTAPAYLLFLLGSGFSTSFASLLVCRFFAGWTGGPVLAVGAGTIADMWEPRNRAVASAAFVMMPFLGPSLGPVVGGFAAQYKGWQWTQWSAIIIGAATLIPIFTLSETYLKLILRRHNRNDPATAANGPQTASAKVKFFFTILIARPLAMLAFEPIVLLLSTYTAFTFSVLFAFFAAFPYTFKSVYKFETWQSGLAFLPMGLGVLIAFVIIAVIDRQIYRAKHREAVSQGKQKPTPEHRLYAAQVGSCLVPIGLFWFAWTARADVHWIVPILSGIPFAIGNLTIFVSAILYLIDVYGPLNGASAVAANGMLRYTLGAAFPLFTLPMYERLGINWATSLLGFISLLLLPIPWAFQRYGPDIRSKSRYGLPVVASPSAGGVSAKP